METGKTRLLWVLSAIALALLSLGLFVAKWIAFSPGNTGTPNPDGGQAGDAQSFAGGPDSERCPIRIGTMRQPPSAPAPSRGGAPSGRIGGNRFSTPPPPVGGSATSSGPAGRPGVSPAGKRYIAAYNSAGKDADSLCKEALCYMREGVYSEAERALKASLRMDPNQINARGLLGTIYAYRKRDYPAAATEFSHVLKILPSEGQSLIGRGLCELAMGDYVGAKRDFNLYQRLNPASGRGYMMLGVLEYFRGDRKEAKMWFAEGAEKTPGGYTPNYLWLALMDKKAGRRGCPRFKTVAALAALSRGDGTPFQYISAAQNDGMDDPVVFFFLGEWALTHGRKTDAGKYFQAALDANKADIFSVLADVRSRELEAR